MSWPGSRARCWPRGWPRRRPRSRAGRRGAAGRRRSAPPTWWRRCTRRSWRSRAAGTGPDLAVALFPMDSHAEASVELGAITGNIAALRAHVAPAAMMAVVKADGYGHGAVPAALAAVRGGADWLGVVHVAEALELRRAGLDTPLLCLMAIGSDSHADAIAA